METKHTKHTPGPWRHNGTEVSADAGVIVRSAAAYDALRKDLDLIVAAPDLLTAMEERTLWFATWHEATHYAHKWTLDQKPELREAWADYAWRQGWSLRVPKDWEIPVRNNG